MTKNVAQKDVKEKTENRVRNWTFLVYPESAPENWRELLDSQNVAWIESPIHDKDLEPNGNPKKAHWHIGLIFSGKKSYTQVLEITQITKGARPEPIKEIRSWVRYLTHIDFPYKAQYEQKDIKLHGGCDLDIESYFLTKADLQIIRREIFNYIFDANITEICDLVAYAKDNKPAWYEVLIKSDFLMYKVIDSKRNKQKNSLGSAPGSSASLLAEQASKD